MTDEHSPGRPPRATRTLITLVMVLTAAAYWRGALTFFAVDDYVYLANTNWTFWKDAFEFFVYPRGLTESVFIALRAVFGLQPLLFHIVPFCLHVFNALLVYRLIRWALPDSAFAASIGTLLFTLHPAAYTAMAWLSPGFETLPCLTLSLCAVHMFLGHLERRGWYCLPAALILMILGISFKNNVVLFPAYAGSLGLLFISRARPGSERVQAALRVAIALVPFALFELWFATRIMWRLPHLSHPAYARDLSPGALAWSYEQLLLHTFNVLPFFRFAMGSQEAIPSGFGSAGAGIGAALYRAAFAAGAVAIGWVAIRRGKGVFALAMTAIVVGGVSFAAPLSHHLQDYYAYFVIPAACALLAFPLASLVEPWWLRLASRGRMLAAGALVLYAFAAGTVLHPANRVVRQAATARAVDDFIRTSVGVTQEIRFLPGNVDIAADLTNGLSIRLLHPEKNVTVRFPSVSESQSLSRSTDRTLLLTVRDANGRGPRVYKLDTVQPADGGVGPYLRPGGQIAQRFEVHENGLSEVHVRLEHDGGPCEVTATLFELAQPAARVPIGSNTLPCSNDGFQIVPVAGQRQSAGKTYELELSAAGAATPRLFHVAPAPPGFTPFVESASGNGNGAAPESRVLAFRVVVDSD